MCVSVHNIETTCIIKIKIVLFKYICKQIYMEQTMKEAKIYQNYLTELQLR